MKKRITIFLVLCLAVVSLCGCQSNNEPQDGTAIVSHEGIASSDGKNKADIEKSLLVQKKIKSHYIDVGQGDSEFIELPNGQTVLIDAGESNKGSIVVKYIKSLGYDKIDYVVATHPHSDHIGGMAEVLNGFQIGKMYMPDIAHTSKTFKNLINVIENNKIDLRRAKSGVNILYADGISIDIFAPTDNIHSELNNYSAVVKITYGNTKLLYMGDAEKEIEKNLLSEDVSADIIKIGHHGSDTATTENLIKAVSPKYAVISCGANNQYGHPHRETLDILNNHNIYVYRTDEVGTIVITADSNKKITVDKKATTIKENAPPENTVRNNSENRTVYKTQFGECYHNDGCSYLIKSKIPIAINEAEKEGLRPCKRCQP